MEDQQARKINEAAEKFAEAIKESYQALADLSGSAQELNAHLTQSFFNRVIENLGTQAEGNRALAHGLIEQQRKQREASQVLARESVGAYMDFLGSVFSYPRPGTQSTAPSPQKSGGEEGDTQADAARHPLRSGVWVSWRAKTTFGAANTPGYAASAPNVK